MGLQDPELLYSRKQKSLPYHYSITIIRTMPHHEKKAKKRESRSNESKKKKNRKRHSTSSSSSSESDSGDRFQSVLDKQRSEKRRLRKLEKERLKAKETPEEKRARRLAKKLRKVRFSNLLLSTRKFLRVFAIFLLQEKRKKENSSYLPPQIAYTNLNNPFNDELKRARDARLAAREDMELMQRDADRKTHFEWTSKEAEFQLQQAKVRSKIRIEQNRAKPIDLLSRYIQYGDENVEEIDEKKEDEFELEEPIKYIKGLSQDDYEDLIEDIKVYRSLDGDRHSDFWRDVRCIVDDELRKLRDDRGRLGASIHGSVQRDIDKIFKVRHFSSVSFVYFIVLCLIAVRTQHLFTNFLNKSSHYYMVRNG
ncbi:unnamed protein product [Angiostrongylus costaricensis]|uniref:Cactin_mid domain-containing protein n=1 Tax=Angiostrongylus costaricensis TaxID=334426 RepID=A0A0R3PQ76_ANGCS|nr:unnamed protein product [Angiostrongylus costaricensis]